MAQKEIEGLKIDLEKIGQMTQEDIEKIKEQNKELKVEIDSKKQEIQSGNFQGDSSKEKKISYQKLIEDIDRLTNQIETNQKIIEMYVQVKIERGDFKQLGIKNMKDFFKASQIANDLSIELEEKRLKQADDAKNMLQESYALQQINVLINDINALRQKVQNNVKEIENIEKSIKENEEEIKRLTKELEEAKEEDKVSIRQKIEKIEFVNINLGINKRVLIDENATNIEQINKLKDVLTEKGIEKTDPKSLQNVQKANNNKIKQNVKSIKKYFEDNGISYSSENIEDVLNMEIDLRKANIAEFENKKEDIKNASKTIKITDPNINTNNQNRNANNQNSNTNTQQQGQNESVNNIGQNVGPANSNNNNLPIVSNKNSIFKRAKNRIIDFIDRFNPKLRQQRIEFLKQLHPDWDEKTIQGVANSKSNIQELNDLIKKGVSPEDYIKNEETKENLAYSKDSGNVISDAVKGFDNLIKLGAMINNPEANYSDEVKKDYKEFTSNIRKGVQNKKSDDREEL